jgi:hypothetical protein
MINFVHTMLWRLVQLHMVSAVLAELPCTAEITDGLSRTQTAERVQGDAHMSSKGNSTSLWHPDCEDCLNRAGGLGHACPNAPGQVGTDLKLKREFTGSIRSSPRAFFVHTRSFDNGNCPMPF